jgi:anti-sigma regulatory factor (Ser/Thr protein kinase)
MGRMPLIEHRRRFVAEPQACREARMAVDELADELGPSLAVRLRLMVSELIGNAVVHSGTGGRGLVELELLIADDRVRVTVSDHGHGFEKVAAPTDPLRPGQRGLQIVEGMSDRWDVIGNGKTRVWLEVDRPTA